MPKVLHAYKNYLPEIDGGIPQVISMVSKGLRPLWEPKILAARLKGRGDSVDVDGVPVERVSSAGLLWSLPLAPSFLWRLRCAAAGADLVVHHHPFPLTDLALVAGLPRGKKLVVYWHCEIVKQRAMLGLLGPFLRHTLKKAAAIIVSYPGLIENSPFLRAVKDKCHVVPFGIDLSLWQKTTAQEDERIAALRAQHPRLLITTGRLVSYKGFSCLVDAMRQVDGELMICGEGALYDQLQQQIDAHRLGGRVRLMGYVSQSELKVALHAAKAFVLPSITEAEAFGIVQLEAMACGCPIVNTSLTTAVPWVARHEQEALTVPPSDAGALAQALTRILNDSALQTRLSQNGLVRVASEFELQFYLARTAQIYQQTLGADAQNP